MYTALGLVFFLLGAVLYVFDVIDPWWGASAEQLIKALAGKVNSPINELEKKILEKLGVGPTVDAPGDAPSRTRPTGAATAIAAARATPRRSATSRSGSRRSPGRSEPSRIRPSTWRAG